MLKQFALGASLLAIAASGALAAETQPAPDAGKPAASTAMTDGVLTGKAAFTDWTGSKPGVTRLIRPEDLPAPFVTKSASNAPGLVD